MIPYKVTLECNFDHIMVFMVQESMGEWLAAILYEDLNRPGNLVDDFEYLVPAYYSSPDEYDDFRNLIAVTIFDLCEAGTGLTDEQRDNIECMAEDMIEHRGTMNHKINWVRDAEISQLVNEGSCEYLGRIVSYCENEAALKKFKEIDQGSFAHLRQY